MQNLYRISTGAVTGEEELSKQEVFSVLYHDFFDYPLNFSEMIRWKAGPKCTALSIKFRVVSKNGYTYLDGKDGVVFKRILRKRISAKKLVIAKRASKILSFIPDVKMVAITGSLAMENSSEDSDIDLLIVTKGGRLWTTRALSYFVIRLFGFKVRTPNDYVQKDKLCLNMWLDENDLIWRERNIYSAHEIGQIRPLVNKGKTYETFLLKNKWILDYWPKSVKIGYRKIKSRKSKSGIVEKICFWLQYRHMKSKMTREVITPTRALFHPQDWGKVVLGRLSS